MSRQLLTLSVTLEDPGPLCERTADQPPTGCDARILGGGQQVKSGGELAADQGAARGARDFLPLVDLRMASGRIGDPGVLKAATEFGN